MPWTLTELTAPLDRETFDDVFQEVPTIQEKDEQGEEPSFPLRLRRREKGPSGGGIPGSLPAAGQQAASSSRPEQQREPRRERSRSPLGNDSREEMALYAESFWSNEDSYVVVEVALPESRHGWMNATKNFENYLVNNLKRKNIEVHERRMDSETRAKFQGAKGAEMRTLQALPAHLQPPKEMAMRMRWILTWKSDNGGGAVPKARAVILGYQDPYYEHRVTYAPTTTRHTRQLMLQYAASQRWHSWKGDVSAAFLQGRPCAEDLFCIPTEELCKELGVPRNPGKCSEVEEGLLWFGPGPL